MKKVLFFLVFLGSFSWIYGQVAINQDGSEPAPGAALHVKGAGGNFYIRDADGQVGVGTVNPETTLHILNNQPVLRIQDEGSGNAAVAKIEFGGTNSGSFESVGSIGDFAGSDYLSINSTSAINMTANGINGIYIKDNGYVGIGTNKYASERLHVRGNIYIESATSLSKLTRDKTGNHDLIPIAYGVVLFDGTVLSGTGNFSVATPSEGVFVITIDDEFYTSEDYFTFASIRNTLAPKCIGTASELDSSENPTGNLKVKVWKIKSGGGYALQSNTFNFVVYKP